MRRQRSLIVSEVPIGEEVTPDWPEGFTVEQIQATSECRAVTLNEQTVALAWNDESSTYLGDVATDGVGPLRVDAEEGPVVVICIGTYPTDAPEVV